MKMLYESFSRGARALRMARFAALGLAILGSSVASAKIISVVETGGDNEATDTIAAKWSGQSFPVTVANEPIPGAAVGQIFNVGTFDHLAPAFVDRSHRYYSDAALPVPDYLVGSEYIMSGNDNRDNAGYLLDVTVDKPSIAFMLIDNRLGDADGATPPTFAADKMQWILDEGWLAFSTGQNRTLDFGRPDEVAFDEGADNTVNQYYSVYFRSIDTPGTFTLRQADNAGQNMYGAVVQEIVPEPGSLLMGLASLAGLAVARRRR